jgi:alkyl sulfatase BDS1-like metallo-beta-lactamase superfamily hydrolase
VRRGELPPPAASKIYELTEWGRDLEPVIIALGKWGVRSPSKPPDAELGVDSLILSFRTMFDPERAAGFDATYEFRLGEHRFRAEVAEGRLEIERGTAEAPDATVEAEAGTLAALVYDDLELDDALSCGDLRIGGSNEAVERFLTLFPLPEPAAVGA